ncbi:MAG: Subversion of eukaryotic traffic protein A [Chlamydiae bacterium]|nr:Subversion of eukaryotic traffic protein A [Chlamydiota bacterium]
MESKRFIVFLFICLFLTSCSKKEVHQKPGVDFESLMGKELPAWKHVQTKEDFQNLAFFKEIYEKNIPLLAGARSEVKIPKVIHFIWVGPKPFPRESIENVRSWMAHHPDWTVKFWTDRQRPLPHPDMQMCMIREFPFKRLEGFYHNSDNFGEKSDLLRLEILDREGGIYVDHDVTCVGSFEGFNQAYDLYCGMEVPFATALSTSVWPTNNILAARAGHPILGKCMDWLEANWERIEKDYPGKDRDSIINRVSHRTFLVLGENFKKYHNSEGNIDIAFPSFYFNSPKIEWALFAQHQYKGTWFENESDFEKMARRRLMMLSKKTNKLLLAIAILAGLNFVGFGSMALMMRKNRS